jgi:hypothetical protein
MSFVRGDFLAVLQVKIVIFLTALANTVDEVSRQEGNADSATQGRNEEIVGHGRFFCVGIALDPDKFDVVERLDDPSKLSNKDRFFVGI